ncbi:hypothetical protein [Bacillus mycoides]|uniref:hypothetical protein n=1 Tax=Bacillus mycoides TaxID=1405 RepID=UPI000991FA19|nr:hypothetical protein [Bacillus mycoides]OOR18183.1 hypothetical protein BW891_14595 [Bacillus mycoides]
MNLHFETWIKKQNISEDSSRLFDESFLCYRVGAYRAAFLMSYLGFMKCLKDRLLNSDKPDLVDEKRWDTVKQSLNDEDVWENTVITTTQESDRATSQNKYYLISSDLKKEIEYWKIKRNECAHAKNTIIGYSHVDMFWLFIESNLMKFVVNGGKEGLLARIDKHFNSLYVDPRSDASYLIKDIPLVVKPSEIPEFLKEIYDNHVSLHSNPEESSELFWRQIIHSTDLNVSNAALEFISSDEGVFFDFITHFPNKLIELNSHTDEFVRVLWKKRLFSRFYISNDNFWEIVCILLTHRFIPISDLEFFISRLAGCISVFRLPNEDHTKILKQTNLFSIIKKQLFESGKLNKFGIGYNTANNESHRIIYYLENVALDDVVVSELNELFKTFKFGSFFEMMEQHIEDNPRFITDFREIAKNNDIVLVEFFAEDIETEMQES